MTILEKIKFEEDWLSEVNLTKENIKIAFAGIRATALEQQPCEDCISREAVMKCFKKWQPYMATRLLDYEQELEELPSVTPKAEWTPVSERLPEEFVCDDGYVEPSDYVLVWGDHGNYGVSRYWGNRKSKIENPNSYKDWMDLDWVVQKPIAWCELPEPYKTESEVQE